MCAWVRAWERRVRAQEHPKEGPPHVCLVFLGAGGYLIPSSCDALLGRFASFCCWFGVRLESDDQLELLNLGCKRGRREWLDGGGWGWGRRIYGDVVQKVMG